MRAEQRRCQRCAALAGSVEGAAVTSFMRGAKLSYVLRNVRLPPSRRRLLRLQINSVPIHRLIASATVGQRHSLPLPGPLPFW